MATPWDDVNAIFFDKIEKDSDFFNYYNLSDDEAMSLATERADSCLKEAAVQLALKSESDIDFSDFNDTLRVFNYDATYVEKDLLASLQYEAYMSRDIAKLKVFSLNFTPNDLQVFDPSNGRRSFMQMYDAIKEENRIKIDAYNSRNRTDNSKKYIDYSSYDED